MSTDFPEIPSTEELMREANEMQAGGLDVPESYKVNEQQDNAGMSAEDWAAQNREDRQRAETNGDGQFNQVEPFRANPPYMIGRPDWPSNEYKGYEQEPSARLAELKKAYTDIPLEQRRRPVFEIQHQGQTVELSPLVKAYARFTSEQTLFLETGGSLTPEQYQQALRRYSGEQSRLIRAQAEALRQAGIL